MEDQLQVAGITLHGLSSGGVHTSIRCPELDVLFDVGGAFRKQMRHDTVLVTHGHQDHLGELMQLASRRQLDKRPPLKVHVPQAVLEPLQRIIAAWAEIEGFELAIALCGHEPGQRVWLSNELEAVPLRAHHRVPALAWVVVRHARKLRSEFRDLAAADIAAARRAGEQVTEVVQTPVLAFSGDTKIELFDEEPLIRAAKVLMFEVTSWDERRGVDETRAWGHTHVDEVIARAERFEGEALVVVHRSPRHTREQAQEVVRTRFPAGVRERVHVFGR